MKLVASDLEVLDLACEYAEGSRLEKDILRRKIHKIYRKVGMQALFNALTPERRYSIACARIYLGDFSNYSGWSFRDGWAMLRNFAPHDVPMWRGENVERLIVFGEQGVGDQILWASVLPEAMCRCKQVTYTCDARLGPMLARSLPGLITTDADWNNLDLHDFDAYIAAADLLPLFRQRRSHFPRRPFLRPRSPDVHLSHYRGRIGIGWSGRQGAFDPLKLDIRDPVSLQHNGVHYLIERPPIDLHNDLEATLSLVSALAGVVCVPSSIHHLAGATGVQVDIIWPETIGEVNQVPWSHPPGPLAWYPNATVYKTIGEWRASSPLARAARSADALLY